MELSLNEQQNDTKKKTKSTKPKKTKTENVEVVMELETVKVSEVIIDETVKALEPEEHESVKDNNEISEVNSENSVELSYSTDEYIQKMILMNECLAYMNSVDLKNLDLTKENMTKICSNNKKSNQLLTKHNSSLMDHMCKENCSALKKESKNSKPKKVVDPSTMSINKKLPTYPEVLTFAKLADDSLISRAQLIQIINAFVKTNKEDKESGIYVNGDNKSFNLIGDLKVLFDFVKSQMITRGDLKVEDEASFPKKLGYRDIMKYLKYCHFPK
jgi:hypothetical protein